jgi:hypothetical protein
MIAAGFLVGASWRSQDCGAARDLQVHHIRSRGQLGDDAEENLITPHFLFELCVSGRMSEPTPVFMRLREQNEFYGGSTQWVRNKISPFSSRLIRL